MMRLAFVILGFTAIACSGIAQEIRCYHWDHKSVPRERFVDFLSASLDIEVDPYEQKVHGTVLFTCIPLRPMVDTLWLDGPKMEVDEAYLNGSPVSFTVYPKGITLVFPQKLDYDTHKLEVRYTAFPRKGMYFNGWNDPSGLARKQVWTQGQGIDNRHWFPHFDDMSDKLIMDIRVTFPSGYPILSNGALRSVTKNEETTTWHYGMDKPHASYLAMIGGGEYAIDTVLSRSGVPIQLWYYPDEASKKDPTYFRTQEMFDHLEDYLGVPYPWQKYAQLPVQDFLYGAMENTTATVFADNYYIDSRTFPDNNYVFVNAHEFAHQWFGNWVTSRSPEAHWLHESFATFFHAHWQGEVFGQEAYDHMMESFAKAALAAGEKDDYPISDSRAGSARHYMKGACVLRMLRDSIGEHLFQKGIRHYLNKHARENVNSPDLLRAFHEATGLALDGFWDQWIYRGGEPELKVTANWDAPGKESFTVTIDQVQDTTGTVGLFSYHLPLVIQGKKKQDTIRVFLTGDTTVTFSKYRVKQVQWIEVDPGKRTLSNIRVDQPIQNWRLQAAGGSHFLARKEAWKELRKREDKALSNYVLEQWEKEPSNRVRQEMVRACSEPDIRMNLLKQETWSTTPSYVKLAWFADVPDVEWDPAFRSFMQDTSYAVIRTALNEFGIQYPERLGALLTLSEESSKQDPSLRISWLSWYSALYPADESAKAELVQFAGPRFNYTLREQAMYSIAQLGLWNEQLFTYLVQGRSSTNRRVSGMVCSFIQAQRKNTTFYKDLDAFLEVNSSGAERLRKCMK